MMVLYIFLALVNLALPVLMFTTRASKIGNNPIDDSEWQFNNKILDTIRAKFIANKQETIEGLLGKKSIIEIISKNDSKYGFCFVTNKAYYFVGSVYQSASGGKYRKTNVQHRINADELKGVNVKRIFLFRTLFFFLLTISVFLLDVLVEVELFYIISNSNGAEQVSAAIFIISHVICGILIFTNLFFMIFKRRTVLSFEFASLSLYFPVGILGKQEIVDFYQAVSKVQSIAKNQPQVEIVSTNYHNAVTSTTLNKVEQLKELSVLLGQGNISAEEFESLKAEIINNKTTGTICPQCAAKISSDAKFCGRCGHKM